MARYTLKTKNGTRVFACPDAGGYVVELIDDAPYRRQVSQNLSQAGEMMIANEKTLKEKIQKARRRELRLFPDAYSLWCSVCGDESTADEIEALQCLV